jgi:hypothetical protein
MNTYFLTLLQEEKNKGHYKPLSKFLVFRGETNLVFSSKYSIFMLGIESLFNEVVWSVQLSCYKNIGSDYKVGTKSEINLILQSIDFKRKNLFLRLTDSIIQNPV